MREQKTKVIDNVEYKLDAVSPFIAWDVFQRLCSYGLGPILKALLKESKGAGKSIMDIDLDDALPAIAESLEIVFTKLPAGEMRKICAELIESRIIVSGKKPPSFEMHMNNHGVVHLLKLVRFSLEVNFADFLPGLQGVVGASQE